MYIFPGIEYYIGLPPHLFHRFARIHKTSFWEGRIDLVGSLFSLLNPYLLPVAYSWDIQIKVNFSDRQLDQLIKFLRLSTMICLLLKI